MTTLVEISRRAEKGLRSVPKQVAISFFLWKREVETHGLEEVRKISGYHDEPLEGKLKGYARSVRLGKGFRAYYSEKDTKIRCLYVEEVNKHDYKKIERLFGL